MAWEPSNPLDEHGNHKPAEFETTREEITEIFSRALLNGCIELECGCLVEPDGVCHHENESPLLTSGLI